MFSTEIDVDRGAACLIPKLCKSTVVEFGAAYLVPKLCRQALNEHQSSLCGRD